MFQYNPVLKKYIRHSNPKQYIIEHIIRGDRTDGIPNVLSNDDVFVQNLRQKPLTKKKINEIINDLDDGELLYAASWYRNYCRNETLIEQLVDLSFVPDYVRKDVMKQYNEQNNKDRSKLFNYFINYNLKNLVESIGDF